MPSPCWVRCLYRRRVNDDRTADHHHRRRRPGDPRGARKPDSIPWSVQANALASVPEFLNEGRPDGPTCLVLDVRLSGLSGLDFQRELSAANIHVPIIFITGYGDIPMSVQ